jgi:hypothetical protein
MYVKFWSVNKDTHMSLLSVTNQLDDHLVHKYLLKTYYVLAVFLAWKILQLTRGLNSKMPNPWGLLYPGRRKLL